MADGWTKLRISLMKLMPGNCELLVMCACPVELVVSKAVRWVRIPVVLLRPSPHTSSDSGKISRVWTSMNQPAATW